MTQDTGQPDPIIRSVTALALRTRQALSPWVQRCLGAEHEAAGSARPGEAHLFNPPLRLLTTRRPERTGHYRRHRQTAFTAAPTRSLVGRVQRVVERGTVWRPDVGSLKPAMVARFAGAIVNRLSPLSAKYRPRSSDAEAAQELELPLAGGPTIPGLATDPPMGRTDRPAPSPSTLPPLPRQIAPTVQRTVTPPPAAKPPTPTLPKGARLFSRIEELPKEGEAPTEDAPSKRESLAGDESPEGQPTRTEQDTDRSASAEVKAASGWPETPPEPGRPQPQTEQKMPDLPLSRPAPRRERSAEPHRTGEPAPPSPGEGRRILARAASRRRLPLTAPLPLSHRQVTAHLVTRGWRFKRKERSAPAAPDLVARAVDDLERTTSPGRPLEHKPRVMMKRVLGRDFSDVRIHTARLAPLDIQAATRGRDVYVEPGQDRFDTPESVSLLGHELTHVAQGSGIVSTKPVAQTAILPQVQAPARLEGEEAKAESTEQTILDLFRPAAVQKAEAAEDGTGLSMPVSPVGRPTSAGQVQRQPFTSPMDTWVGEEELVEGAGEEGLPEIEGMEGEEGYLSEAEEEEEEELLEEEKEPKEKPDLDRLARQVYPFIKRLLAVERERMAR